MTDLGSDGASPSRFFGFVTIVVVFFFVVGEEEFDEGVIVGVGGAVFILGLLLKGFQVADGAMEHVGESLLGVAQAFEGAVFGLVVFGAEDEAVGDVVTVEERPSRLRRSRRRGVGI